MSAEIPQELLPAPVSSEGRLRSRDFYSKPPSHFAGIYGVSSRSVNNWINHGRSVGELPPLENPVDLVAWWGKHMVHRVPDKLYAAAAKFAPEDPDPAPPTLGEPQGISSDPPRDLPASPSSDLSTGFLASLLRTREEEAKAHRRYTAAISEEPPNEGKIRVAQKTWADLADHLRQLEKAAPEILQKSGEMWLRVEVIRELAPLHGEIVKGVRSLGRKFAMKEGIPWSVERDRAFEDECNVLFGKLVESRFSGNERRDP